MGEVFYAKGLRLKQIICWVQLPSNDPRSNKNERSLRVLVTWKTLFSSFTSPSRSIHIIKFLYFHFPQIFFASFVRWVWEGENPQQFV